MCVLCIYPHHKGYKCLSSEGKIYISLDVIFDETKFTYPNMTHLTIKTNTIGPTKSIQLRIITSAQPTQSINQTNALNSSTAVNPKKSINLNPISHVDTGHIYVNSI